MTLFLNVVVGRLTCTGVIQGLTTTHCVVVAVGGRWSAVGGQLVTGHRSPVRSSFCSTLTVDNTVIVLICMEDVQCNYA